MRPHSATVLLTNEGSSMLSQVTAAMVPILSSIALASSIDTPAIAQTIDVPPPVVVPPPPPPESNLGFPERDTMPREQYLVYVASSDREILAQVRAVDSSADYGLFQGQQIIQAGLFSNSIEAEERAQQLAARGIASGIARVIVEEPAMPSTSGADADSQDAPYYVVIPGNRDELARSIENVRSAIDPRLPVVLRDRPLGPHIAIGPFAEREAAEQLSEELRRRGLRSTRVYYDP